jgi:hypothetical protein
MSFRHKDRVAQQDPRQCFAYGCPMQGSISSGTTGSSKWLCWLHHGEEADRWQRITADLRRMEWLVMTITTLRRDCGSVHWDEAYATADRAMRQHQRSDLRHIEGEKLLNWFSRLDAALRACCSAADEALQQTSHGIFTQPGQNQAE